MSRSRVEAKIKYGTCVDERKCKINKELKIGVDRKNENIDGLLKAVPEEKTVSSNIESECILSIITDDLVIMDISSEFAQGNCHCTSAALKDIKLTTPSKPSPPKTSHDLHTSSKLSKARRKIIEEEKVLSIDPVFGVTEEALEDEGIIFSVHDANKPKVASSVECRWTTM
eukprot:TRINITY_DN6500_c0_g1_i4.p2 TRINITY_DN6500_c0_g1~~TRINITY_DN6500_c0_g1_i4.p2  ORF type:complete len:171 (+),score=26.41 TRINITY_DN6500_c0_g1_i4:128-640(+)